MIDSCCSSTDPLDCPALRWGIVGCGRISNDFVQALKLIPSAKVVAVAARDVCSSRPFAKQHGIGKYYGSYDELVADEDVEIVYVANPHTFRRTIGEKILLANKHLLLEKPFACSATDAKYLVSLAKKRNLFLMEGMWTKFFPAFKQARMLAMGTKSCPGVIGDIVSVQSDFNFDASDSEEYPTSQAYNRRLGGGASFHLAPYTIAAATSFFEQAAPTEVKATGFVDDYTGVDLQASMSLSFPPKADFRDKKDEKKEDVASRPLIQGIASMNFGFLGESAEETVVIGTKGRLVLHSPAHCPTYLTLTIKGHGRGKCAKKDEYYFPLPRETDEIDLSGGFYYPGSSGFAYEAAAVARYIASGKTEAQEHSLRETVNNIEILDHLRRQLGLTQESVGC